MDVIRLIDLSGSAINLNIRGNLNIKTILGGFFTIILLFIFFILFFILGKSFYKREKPILTNSVETPPSYFNFTLNSSTFLFAFRSDNQDGQTVNLPEMFYFQPRYIVYRKVSGKGSEKVIDKLLTYHKCRREDFNNNTIYDIQALQNWYCFDWTNEGITVGGLYDNELIQYIKIKMFHCDRAPASYLKENNITCSRDETYLRKIFKDYIYFSVIIQNIMIDADIYENPFTLGFNNLYDTLDLSTTKKVYYYMKMGNLRDDKGWLLDDIEETLLYGLDRVKYDVISGNKEILKSDYYECNLYFDNIKEKYERKFLKIQELMATLGGLMKSFSVIISIFLSLYNTYHRDLFIIKNSFDFYNKNSFLQIKKKLSNDDTHNNHEINKSIIKLEEDSSRELTKHLCRKSFNENKITNSKKVLFVRKNKLKNDDNDNLMPSINLKIGYFNFIRSLFCKLKDYKNKQLNIFKEAHKIMSSKLDVINIIKNFHKLDTIAEVLFDEEGVNKLNRNKRLYLPE